jgi:predicted nucleic acid-binding protein
VAVRVVLDTNVILYMLGGRIADMPPLGRYYVSVISALELLSFPALGTAEEQQIRAFLAAVAVIELTADVQAATIAVRRKHGFKLPDAIVVGTAMALDAALATNDRRLSRVPEVTIQHMRLTEE